MAEVKEVKIVLNTNDGQTDFQSEKQEGKLSSIIISSDDEVAIMIDSSLGYSIFHIASHKGVKYYAPRAVLVGVKRDLKVKDQFDEFLLNEPLDIIINGGKNKEVEIILRYS